MTDVTSAVLAEAAFTSTPLQHPHESDHDGHDRIGNIPDDLRGERRWVVTRMPSKVPLCAFDPNRNASSTDPSTWSDFTMATDAIKHDSGLHLGFVLGDGWVGVDLDKCRDPETGDIEPFAEAIIDRLDSYTESSVSGTGVHVICRGALPSGGRRKGQIEMYDKDRYFVMTGTGSKKAIADRTLELAALHAETFGVVAADAGDPTPDVHRTTDLTDAPDDVVLNQIRASRQGAKFQRLWAGDTTQHANDDSAADLALCAILAYWVSDPQRIDRLFRMSGLCRDKWTKRADYRQKTIMKAMKSVTTKRGTLPSHPEGDNEAPRNATSVSKSYGAQLVRLIKGRADSELFHSPDNTPYITVGGKTMGLRQSDFKEWLSHEYYRTTDRVPSASALNDAIAALVGAALHDGPVRQVFTRVAALDDAVHIDLGDRVVEVTAAGWHVRDQSDVRFLQRPGFLPLPVPIKNTQSLDVLFKTFLNVSAEDDLRLVISAVLSALRGKKPFPVLSVSGEQGSAKSSACRFLRQLIDPNSADTRLPPRDLRDLMIAARNGYLIAFDNLTRIDDTLANGLCCLSTGAGAATRALCTDTDEVLISVARPVLLNGINDTVRRPDLLDRTLQVTLDPIPDHVRKTEQEVKAAFERVQPLILGRLLDAVACALKNEPTTRPAQIPRMADFAITVTAAEPALGWQPGSFLEILRDTRRSAINGLLDGDPVGAAIQNLSLPWQGTATALRARLMNGTADPDQFPKNAKSMANRLRELAPGLRETGIRVEFVKGHTRGIKISRVTGGLTLVTPCLDSEDAEETRCA